MINTERACHVVLYAAGFAVLVMAPFLIVYLIGAFASWDAAWIASKEFADTRAAVAIVQVVWVCALSIAASGS